MARQRRLEPANYPLLRGTAPLLSGWGGKRKGTVRMGLERILVALDGSRMAERVVPYAGAVATQRQSEVTFLSVLTPELVRMDLPVTLYLDTLAAPLRKMGLKTSVKTLEADYGKAADEIIGFAETDGSDLIVISSHAYSGVKRWILGSVAQKVLQGACVPVLLVKSKAPEVSGVELKKLLIALDGSAFAEVSLTYVEDMARGKDMEVVLLRLSEPPPDVPENWSDYTMVTRAQTEALQYLQRIEGQFKSRGIRAKSLSLQGKAAAKIVEVAHDEGVDLIVMTTHGRSGVSRWVYGSVASRVLDESLQPILFVRPCPPSG